ncbi:MAG: hypothetical protein ACREQL_04580 [Candidatus Binatia bacterium]
MRRTRNPFWLLPLAGLAVVFQMAVGTAATTRQCTDPCLQSARAEAKDCTSSASGAFQTALDGCLERDHECVDACRWNRQECRDATGIGGDLAACQLELAAAKADCDRFPRGSKARIRCIDQAQIAGFQCRRRALRRVRREFRSCEAQFKQCADACEPGGPSGGVSACRSEAKAAFQSVVAGCRAAYQATASACIDKDLTCTQDCIDARETCNAPTQTTLDAALATCTAQEQTAVSACVAANPAGSSALQDCITTAQANAFTCRDAALEAAGPGFAACAGAYLSCVHGCPSAQSGSAVASVVSAAYGSTTPPCTRSKP